MNERGVMMDAIANVNINYLNQYPPSFPYRIAHFAFCPERMNQIHGISSGEMVHCMRTAQCRQKPIQMCPISICKTDLCPFNL